MSVIWMIDEQQGIYGLAFACQGCVGDKAHLHAIPVRYPSGEGLRAKIHPSAAVPTHPVWSIKAPPKPGEVMDITPSLDASKSCGWHGPYHWQVKVKAIASSYGEALAQADF